jgi:hypothetical protein
MAKTWVLDTETKGTGANMVPLDKVLERRREADYWWRRAARRKPLDEAHEPAAAPEREPYRFRVVDVMTRQVLASDVDARGVVAALGDVRSVVDVIVDVWDPDAGEWRQLTLGELKRIWQYRGAGASG